MLFYSKKSQDLGPGGEMGMYDLAAGYTKDPGTGI
ncbi:Protein of unknown function [Bacillus mycoides]|nr:Protein of unknown function [Bacillus mycoides]